MRVDADLGAVVGAEAEPQLLVGLGEGRVGGARADGVDADALLQQRHRLAADVGTDRLLAPHVVGFGAIHGPLRCFVEVGDVQVLLQLGEAAHPAEAGG